MVINDLKTEDSSLGGAERKDILVGSFVAWRFGGEAQTMGLNNENSWNGK